MQLSTSGSNPDRPNRPLVVKCAYDGSARRITFPSATSCRLDSLRDRVEECFFLSASPFSLAYTDDDGEEFCIKTDADFTEAIAYFVSGDDEVALSSYSGSNLGHAMYPFSAQKITIRLDVKVDYDGPSLSDTSSVSSFRTGSGSLSESTRDEHSEGSWRSSGYQESMRNGRRLSGFDTVEEELESLKSRESELSHGSTILGISTLGLTDPAYHYQTASLSSTSRTRPSRTTAPQPLLDSSPFPSNPPILTGPESDPAPSLLTHSDLGTRWLRDQSRLAARKLGPTPQTSTRSGDYDSDEDSDESDEEHPGDIALVRDARGRYYYSYQTDASSRSSRSEADHTDIEAGPSSRPLSGLTTNLSLSTSPAGIPYHFQPPYEPVRIAEPTGPPILAPDCSACGLRLDYMRYVCQTCGEGDMWKEDAMRKDSFLPILRSNGSDASDESSSDATEWAAAKADSTGSQTIYNVATPRSRRSSSSTDDSAESWRTNFGGQSSPTTAMYRHHNEGISGTRPPGKPRGYELCAGCIEIHGIAHSKAAALAAKQKLGHSERRRRRNVGEFRHTFREKTWAAEGWIDVDYSEESECSICHSHLFNNRYKCVSCTNFDLCRTCYQKIEEIHPTHVFLSLPDKQTLLSIDAHERDDAGDDTHIQAKHLIPQPMRHPGAFCHNCLQDIVGPRFHCAVCAVDLCIQCEAVVMEVDGSSHTADHIMMKIPVPISSNEVDAVSRKARERWFQQDRSMTNNNLNPFADDGETTSSRSSSPTNNTIYAPTSVRNRDPSPVPPRQVVNVTTRDALDHNLRCGNCNEWIMGRRYQCANCPSDPQGYNLCSICELRSYRLHNPSHVFFKFDRPVHISVQSSRPILPLLYRNPVGKVPTSALTTINPRDPTAYLKHVLHRETLCDVHGDQIRGVWLRCCHCAAGFDVCQEAERLLEHDPTHVFVMFKSRVDMVAFRALCDLGASQAKPLLKQRVYVT
ncbi:uncharacterized protein IL334_005887 [Kwoniella shivajii]|uniref:ZZ-type domain-containing protein n=1 Tax=Kwoniella shivajii TaxID=564305 RepID=A0ABZ1D4D3_9TREE|nr:hypothetical protein IL334_005887 [Kwoniella shivajii]